jgi:hypothetical protein
MTIKDSIRPALTLLLAVSGTIGSTVLAASQDSTTTEGPTLTVYSTADPAGFDPQEFISNQGRNDSSSYARFVPGFALIRETRDLQIKKGLSELRFTDVAAFIDPTTVGFADLTSRGTTVLEQNFEFDLVSPAKLLKKYIDREVTLSWDTTGQSMTGTLLSANGDMAVLDVRDHMAGAAIQIVSTKDARISMGELPGGLITRPTLVWKLNSPVQGTHRIQTSYETAGITWRADYNLTLGQDESSADLTAWVSLMNVSGSSYEQAKLKLVAGDVQRVQPKQNRRMPRGVQMMEADMSFGGAAGFEQESFFEYHLYTLPRRTDVRSNGTQQLTLFPPIQGFKIKKELLYQGAAGMMRGNWPNNPATNAGFGVSGRADIEIFVEFENKEDNGLGMPMPAGKIRAYKENPRDGSLVFLGEDVIDHTPRNETVRMKIGNAFDVVGERTQVDFNVDTKGKTMTETWSIEIRNQKAEAQTVVVREPLYRWRNWEITRSSEDYTKLDARTVQWDLDVPAEGKKTITYTVRYSW